nr:hypothetical protein GCM10020092_027700 [Actinoplanes digitatis]
MHPSATYRVQVHPGFPLKDTAELVDYLADLGVSHLYTAPLLTAVPGSGHGYDVVDHGQVSPALGGEQGWLALKAALDAAGLGLVIDIVPNHAGVAMPAANPTWWEVLRDGRSSAYAKFYDIDWSRGRLLLPVLADEPDALEKLTIEDSGQGRELRYFDRRFPIADGTGEGTPREVHDRQHYELVAWTRGDSELGYRRFFSIVDLAGLRVEDPEVFEATHREILRWYAEGGVQGIRVDHPDGLRDPGGYLHRLREAAPDAWIVIEKILEPGEKLPRWPVVSTTGYDALAEVCGVFVDPGTEAFFDTLDHHLIGGARPAGRTWCTGPSCTSPPSSSPPSWPGCAGSCPRSRPRRGRSPSSPPASPSTAPTCRPAPGIWPRPGPRPTAASPRSSASSTSSPPGCVTRTTSWRCGSSSTPAR